MADEVEIILKADGLWTNPNRLTSPEGALSLANNLVSLRPGLVETRRGFKDWSNDIGGNVNVFGVYQESLIAHYGVNKLARFTGNGVKTDYSGTYLPPSGRKVKMLVDQGNLYFTSSNGLYVVESLTGQPKAAGLVPPVWMTDPAKYEAGTFLEEDEIVAYRALVGYTNANGRLILSGVSDAREYTNDGTGACGVSVGFGAIGSLTTSHFVQVGRTRRSNNGAAGDEFYVVLERNLTSAEAAGGIISFNDNIPDELLGAPFYTNPSQETMIQSNEPPPLAKTACAFSSSMVYGNTKSIHRKIIRLLSPPRQGDKLTIDGVTYTAWESPVSTYSYQTVITGTVSQRIRQTAMNLCRHINGGSAAPRHDVIARYISGPYDSPGQILLERPDVSYGAFTVTADEVDNTKTSVSRASNVVTVNSSLFHGLVAGDTISATSSDANFPSGTKTVQSVTDADTFTYNESGSNATHSGTFTWSRTSPTAGELWNPQIPSSGTAFTSSDDTALNRIFISKPNAPEAVPLINQYPVGTLSNDIVHLERLSGSLFAFKRTEGLWKITGDAISGLNISLFDDTVELVSPETVRTLDNTIFCLTRKGVVRISEAGVSEPISLAIEDQILSLYGAALETVQNVAHAEAYESEGLYILYLPSLPGDTFAKQAFVYSVRSGGWTRWTKPASAIINHEGLDKLYLGTNDGHVVTERKARNSGDHQDEDGQGIRVDLEWRPVTGESPSNQKRWREVVLFLQDDTTNELTLKYATDTSVTLMPLAARLPLSLEGGSGSSSSVELNTAGLATASVRAPVPLDRCRSSRLILGIYHEAAGEKLSCAGVAVLLRMVGSRLKR